MAAHNLVLHDSPENGWGMNLDFKEWDIHIVLNWLGRLDEEETFRDQYENYFTIHNLCGTDFTRNKLGNEKWCREHLNMTQANHSEQFSVIVRRRITQYENIIQERNNQDQALNHMAENPPLHPQNSDLVVEPLQQPPGSVDDTAAIPVAAAFRYVTDPNTVDTHVIGEPQPQENTSEVEGVGEQVEEGPLMKWLRTHRLLKAKQKFIDYEISMGDLKALDLTNNLDYFITEELELDGILATRARKAIIELHQQTQTINTYDTEENEINDGTQTTNGELSYGDIIRIVLEWVTSFAFMPVLGIVVCAVVSIYTNWENVSEIEPLFHCPKNKYMIHLR